jgi:LacI family gluconate utilization system Gnt-I transcriptional repressor
MDDTPANKPDLITPPPRRSRRKSGGTTLRDVAALAGVAPITASRALNTPNAVSEQILQRVKSAVEQTGYVPNMLAGGLASRKSRLVAAVIPTISGNVFLEVVQSLTASLAAYGYQLMLGQSGYEDSREDELLETIIGRRPDGVVLTGIMRSPQGRQRLLTSGIPVVETWDLTDNPIDMLIGFSHEKVGESVARYLHARGKRRVATLSANDQRAQRRMKSFSDTAISLGMALPGESAVPASLVSAPTNVGMGRAGLRELLKTAAFVAAVLHPVRHRAVVTANKRVEKLENVPMAIFYPCLEQEIQRNNIREIEDVIARKCAPTPRRRR